MEEYKEQVREHKRKAEAMNEDLRFKNKMMQEFAALATANLQVPPPFQALAKPGCCIAGCAQARGRRDNRCDDHWQSLCGKRHCEVACHVGAYSDGRPRKFRRCLQHRC